MGKIIVIVGPTGVGKTALSIKLAKEYNAEIINSDKMAMYKETNIGTAKVTKEEMDGVTHHMVGNISLNDNYTIYNFQKDGRNILDKLIKEAKNIIIAGGSGLYNKVLLYDYIFEEESGIKENFNKLTNDELKDMADKISENNIHKNNRKRLIRFINSYKNSNKIIKNNENKDKPLYHFQMIGLTTNRSLLYKRVNNRVDIMIEKGLVEEARFLYDMKYSNLENIIGYKELLPYFDGKITLEKAIDDIKKHTRHYVKRQYTWYAHQFDNIKWFNIDFNDFNNTIKEVIDFIN